MIKISKFNPIQFKITKRMLKIIQTNYCNKIKWNNKKLINMVNTKQVKLENNNNNTINNPSKMLIRWINKIIIYNHKINNNKLMYKMQTK